jgi:hypothetical protein
MTLPFRYISHVSSKSVSTSQFTWLSSHIFQTYVTVQVRQEDTCSCCQLLIRCDRGKRTVHTSVTRIHYSIQYEDSKFCIIYITLRVNIGVYEGFYLTFSPLGLGVVQLARPAPKLWGLLLLTKSTGKLYSSHRDTCNRQTNSSSKHSHQLKISRNIKLNARVRLDYQGISRDRIRYISNRIHI